MRRHLSDAQLAAYLRGTQTTRGVSPLGEGERRPGSQTDERRRGDSADTRARSSHHAVTAEPDAYKARSGHRSAGRAVKPTRDGAAPPATYDDHDPDQPISDPWYALDHPAPLLRGVMYGLLFTAVGLAVLLLVAGLLVAS